MSLIIGTPIAEPMFSRVRNPQVWGYARMRECAGCQHRWATVEVSLYEGWPTIRANLCPEHKTPGVERSKSSIYMYQHQNRGHPCRGEADVFTYGGVYRRRWCSRCMSCGHLKHHHKLRGCVPVRNKPGCDCLGYEACMFKGKARAWTTGEYAAEGVVVADASRCVQCGGQGEILRKVDIDKYIVNQRVRELGPGALPHRSPLEMYMIRCSLSPQTQEVSRLNDSVLDFPPHVVGNDVNPPAS